MHNKHSHKISPWFSRLCIAALLTTSFTVAANEADVSKQLVGAWSKASADKESGDTEILMVEFKPDGSYSTQLQSKLFGETKNSASGRYSVTDVVKDTFTLKITVLKGDPEIGKEDALIAVKMRQIDANTLQADDGQIVRRLK